MLARSNSDLSVDDGQMSLLLDSVTAVTDETVSAVEAALLAYPGSVGLLVARLAAERNSLVASYSSLVSSSASLDKPPPSLDKDEGPPRKNRASSASSNTAPLLVIPKRAQSTAQDQALPVPHLLDEQNAIQPRSSSNRISISELGGDSSKREVFLEGFLVKKVNQHGVAQWKSRYFRLKDDALEEYDSKLASIPIKHSTTISPLQTPPQNSSAGTAHAFTLTELKHSLPGSPTPVMIKHTLCTHAQADRDAWVDAVLARIPAPPSTTRRVHRLSEPNLNQHVRSERAESLEGLLSAAQVAAAVGMVSGLSPVGNGFNPVSPSVSPSSGGGASSKLVSPGVSTSVMSPGKPSSSHPPITYQSPISPISPPSTTASATLTTSAPPPTTATATPAPQQRTAINLLQEGSTATLGIARRGLNIMFGTTTSSSSSTNTSNNAPKKQPLTNTTTTLEPTLPRTPLFGTPLPLAVSLSHLPHSPHLPSPLSRCLDFLHSPTASHLHEEGIYRLSGSTTAIQALKVQFDQTGDVDLLAMGKGVDVHCVTGLLKLYLRELPDPILGVDADTKKEIMRVTSVSDKSEKASATRAIVARLPVENRALLKAMCGHLKKVVDAAAWNKMGMGNVSIVFAPTLGVPGGVLAVLVGEWEGVFEGVEG
ncbi:hypothetical protein HDU98_009783, partial [Podochytrium sp. JEL0797]